MRTALLAAALVATACAPHPAALRIAAAADLRFALDDVVQTYTREHPEVKIEPVYGSSGLFYAQLQNHAPFDLFLSADVEYPHKLAQQGLILPGSEFNYAVGRIVLWTRRSSGIDVEHLGIDALRQPAVHHIAIANPEHAPYGRAADAALHSLGVYDAVKDKIVMGENISQAFQLAESGAADVGIVALSLAMASGVANQGRYWEVPASAYPRLEQGGAIPKWSRDTAAAQRFRAFLLAPEGRAILKRYGFSGE
ncbi:MAG TPA: molybdate ABC transporter substrate-binding protein [Bryobacteraceae bacterium]|nr:molybdate ABC transporter substrate-binding protein [Bryobacteraceae bacterium]